MVQMEQRIWVLSKHWQSCYFTSHFYDLPRLGHGLLTLANWYYDAAYASRF